MSNASATKKKRRKKMKEYETLVKDIIQEENELKDKINRLEYFMMTEDHQKISIFQRAMLKKQLSVMTEYKNILIDRVIRIRHEHEENKGKDCEPEPGEEEKIEPHVIDAMMYKAQQKIKEKICATCKFSTEPESGKHCAKCETNVTTGEASNWEKI